jgi:tetratricopeptide (TPR) repeat protein
MKPLEPPDLHYLRAADGWLLLGNEVEANADLERIDPQFRAHPDVLEIYWQLYARAQKWKACMDIAEAIIVLDPGRPSAWIQKAYAIRRESGGGPRAAFDALYPATSQFPREPLIPFNLSCYACQMGRLEDACAWLRRAFERAGTTDNKRHLRMMALDEPDLEPLWKRIGKLGH